MLSSQVKWLSSDNHTTREERIYLVAELVAMIAQLTERQGVDYVGYTFSRHETSRCVNLIDANDTDVKNISMKARQATIILM